MNVATLIAELSKLPQDARVTFRDSYSGVVQLLEPVAQVVTSIPSPDDLDRTLVVLIG